MPVRIDLIQLMVVKIFNFSVDENSDNVQLTLGPPFPNYLVICML